jgi:threonine synthase
MLYHSTLYHSTRGQAPTVNFADALLAGLAPDGGLYVPQVWPKLSKETIAGFAGRPFHDVAFQVLKPFVAGSIPDSVLENASREAYASFGHLAVTPLVQVDKNQFILELFHGPTLAFKDVAMQLIARLMDYVLNERNETATIVCATSGDTGGAAAEAFRGRKRIEMVVLFPDGRVSDVQRRMMTTLNEPNIHALSVDGHFDDCQALVKGMFNHHSFRDKVKLAGVNSINWGRIIGQITYYFVAACALGAPHRKISFVVPTGNFGDIFAGFVAKRMGLPIENLIVATNQNDILARTLDTGRYELRDVSVTTSPSMDIQISSNFERLLFDATGGDAGAVRDMMEGLKQSGRFSVPEAALTRIRTEFSAYSATETEVSETIRNILRTTGYLLEPHTATAVIAAQKAQIDANIPVVVLATAHPAKFPEAVKAACGIDAPLPPRLNRLMHDEEHLTHTSNDIDAVEAYILSKAK